MGINAVTMNIPYQPNASLAKKYDANSISNFLFNGPLVTLTTVSSAAINILSAPVRLLDKTNPLKKIINSISMSFTKTHLVTYGINGLKAAWEQKNPFLIFSFAIEALAALFDLRAIYLFRGIATGADGAVAAVKERYENLNPGKQFAFNSFAEGFSYIKNDFLQLFNDIKSNPKLIYSSSNHSLLASGVCMIVGAVVGLTINDKLGAAIRDITGGANDLGLAFSKNKLAKTAGILYATGSFKDLIARFFSPDIGKLLGIKDLELFTRMRDFFHELAIAFDRGGQYYFLKYNQSSNKEEDTKQQSSQEALAPSVSPLDSLHQPALSAGDETSIQTHQAEHKNKLLPNRQHALSEPQLH
jgi:hypothetical protein